MADHSGTEVNTGAFVLGFWGRLCDSVDDSLNPVAARDIGILHRKRLLAATLFVTHAAAIFGLTVQLVAGREIDLGGGTTVGIVHLVAGLLTLFVLPAQAGMALRERRPAVELVLVSGVSAKRLAIGRFLAVFLPGMTVLVSLGPYFLLSYFVGGGEPVKDLQFLCAAIAASAALTAAAAAAGSLRLVSTLAGVVVGGCCFLVFVQLLVEDFDGSLLRYFGLSLPAFLVLCILPSTWFFLGVTGARSELRDAGLEGAIAIGMAAVLGSILSMTIGAFPLGAGPVMLAVITIILLAGASSGLHDMFYGDC